MSRPATTGGRPVWRVHLLALAGIALLSVNLRTAVTSLSPLLTTISTELQIGVAGLSMLGMVPTAMFAVWGLAAPKLIEQLGPERTAVAAMAVAAAGQLVRAVADGPWLLGAGSIIALTGMGIGNVVAPPLVKKYFPQHIAAVSMLYITGLQLGTVVPAMVAVPVAEAAGWRMSIGWWAGLAVIAAVPWIVRSRRTPAPPADPAKGAGQSTAAAATIRPWRSPLGVALALFFGTNSLCTYAFFTWLPAVAESIGLSHTEGGIALGVFSAMGLIASLLVPWLAGRLVDQYPVVVVSAGCYLAGFAGVLWAPQTAIWLWIVLLGIGPSTFPLCLTLINLRTRTAAGSAALSGFSQGVGYTAACAGPVVFGMLFHGPGLPAAFGFLLAVLAVMLVVSRVACRPQILEDTIR